MESIQFGRHDTDWRIALAIGRYLVPRDPSPYDTTTNSSGANLERSTNSDQVHESSGSNGRKLCYICVGLVSSLVIIGAFVFGAEESSHSSNYSPPSTTTRPSPPYNPPSYPSTPTPPWSSPHYPPSYPSPYVPSHPWDKKTKTKSPTISPRPTISLRPTYPNKRLPTFPSLFPPSTRKKAPAKSDSLDGSGNPENRNGNTFKGEDESERDHDIMPSHKEVRDGIKEKE